jgi:hypothetical protein
MESLAMSMARFKHPQVWLDLLENNFSFCSPDPLKNTDKTFFVHSLPNPNFANQTIVPLFFCFSNLTIRHIYSQLFTFRERGTSLQTVHLVLKVFSLNLTYSLLKEVQRKLERGLRMIFEFSI